LGEDHFVTLDYRREIEALKQLTALPEAVRVEYLKAYTLYDEMDAARRKHRYAEALRAAEKNLDIYRRLLGPESFYTAWAAGQCGQILQLAERYAEAEKQFREALRVYRLVTGGEHPGVAEIHGYLARCVEEQGRSKEARELYESAVKLWARLQGAGHAVTAVAL